MKIGNIDLGYRPVMLAPMEDVTDQAFRLLCKEFGASMVYSEFVSADALIRSIDRSLQKIKISSDERPAAVQIYGRDVESMTEAAKIIEREAHPDVLDINWGCPVKKIAKKGCGSGMLQNIPLLLQITKAVVEAVNIPVTVKTRLGWDNDHKIIVELAEQLQDVGIKALTIHGRTRSQMYTGNADWTLIGEVKNNPRMYIPIIGNGDIDSGEKAKEYFDKYGVDGIMVGRATFGRPWIFKEIRNYIDNPSNSVSSSLECEMGADFTSWAISILKRQVLDSVRYSTHGETGGIIHVRRHLASSPIFKGIPNFRQTRIQILRATTIEELFVLLDEASHILSASY
ncbi:MAG: tRNA dihydrouridine synthase DusB [Bacteroidaceae bacterium]|nr:tRNA dihydrouridine synthase DusB [Bacteroidaceae bacterium]